MQGDWIEGPFSGRPVPSETKVEVRFNDGKYRIGKAIRWTNSKWSEIAAYRIEGPADPQAPGMLDGERQGDEQRFWDAAFIAVFTTQECSPGTDLMARAANIADALLAARRLRVEGRGE